ncbi:MAG TPA: CD1871A family CXXC motif-containing protein [Peptococcaceae bacterium]|nr:CD1871A family CXXC motif-containing protein [Peptococcaceae bacterium]HPZ71570.1 CD1871A family CXXC motif-containing protein [Peptococcaceae bacterium]HQD54543.1 CD1871A family CXXC motif-containing protein [Peptococcaceae bacterium]
MNKAKYFFLILSLALIGLGLTRNEQLTVLRKAIRICLECIGIG